MWGLAGRLLVLSLFINILALTSPIYMVQLYDRVLSSLQVETLILLTLMASAALAVYGALEALRGAILNRMGIWVESTVGVPVIHASLQAMLTSNDPVDLDPAAAFERP